MCLSSFIDFKYLNVILRREKTILGRIGLYFCGFGERPNFRDLWNKGEAELILGICGTRQNNIRELRNFFSGI